MRLLTTTCMVLLALIGFGQDVIQFKKGNVVEAKVIEVNDKEITYRLPSKDGEGPLYTVSIEKVEQVQYANGTLDNFEIVKEEFADLNRPHLIEFNAMDLAFQRININYEFFPTKNRMFSLYLPVKFTFNHNQASHAWSNSPWFETGVGANLYMVRKNKSNLSIGLEFMYSYKEVKDYIWIYDPYDPYYGGYSTFVDEKHEHLGFYATMAYKYNFRPRLGLNLGLSGGWKYGVTGAARDNAIGKLDIGVFYRF